MDKPGYLGEESNYLPLSCSNHAEFSLHVPKNSSCYEVITDVSWETSCAGIKLTLPNALDINRPT